MFYFLGILERALAKRGGLNEILMSNEDFE